MKKNIALLFLFASIKIFAQDVDAITALNLIKANAQAFNIKVTNDADLPIITNAYKDVQTGITFIYFQQQYQGIKVFNQLQSAAFKNNLLQYHSGNFVSNIYRIAPPSNPTITAEAAIIAAASNLQLPTPTDLFVLSNSINNKIVFSNAGIAKRNMKAELFWLTDENTHKVNLVWSVQIFPNNTTDCWRVMVDAITGNILQKQNETIYENNVLTEAEVGDEVNSIQNSKFIIHNNFSPPPTTASATYNVIPYPAENLYKGSLTLETNPWLKAGAGNNAITYGWHFDGTDNYNITRGNNVFAYDDSANIDIPGRWATSSSALPNLNFNFSPNFSQQPNFAANRNLAVTNLFYWNNIIHDITYQYGFTEAAGNFQYDNMGRGGVGKDYVFAEAQDGSGLNNANFNPQPDGDTCTMQMYLWTSLGGLTVLTPALGVMTSKEGAMSINNRLKNVGPVTGNLVLYSDGSDNNACNTATNSLSGKIALIKYTFQTGCTYAQRVKNAQNAGAIGVIVIGSGTTPSTMGGSDNTITIPAMMIGISDGTTLMNAVGSGTVTVKMDAGIMYDGDLDNGIIVHEYTHGISNRLTAGAASATCLSNAEQGGEGWSDYVSLMLTTNWATATMNDGNIARRIGVYAANQTPTGYGIRSYPYTTNMTVNPLTYSNVATNGQVHFIGTIWCSTLWDLTWDLIKAENSISANLYNANGSGGNVMAMNLVMLGMKLQPCSPGFLDARDAILAADDILYNGKHKCLIWQSFARRGMGYSAVQGSSNSTTDQVAAFDIPQSVTLNDQEGFKIMPNTTTASFTVKATCQCKIPTNNYTIKAVLPTGFSYTSSVGGGVVSGNAVTFSGLGFNKIFQTDSVGLTITATGTGCKIDTIINDNRDTKTLGGFTNTSINGTNSWAASSQYSKSPINSWQCPDVTAVSDVALTSNVITPAKALSLLSFWHRYDFEGGFDGGVIETSTDNGVTWLDAGDKFIQNKYNTLFDNNAALPNRSVFSGYQNSFINSIINFSKFNGTSFRVRFRAATDQLNGSSGDLDGWSVDDILLISGCGGFIKFYVYDSANNLLDSSQTPLFITPKPVPVKFISFTAKNYNNTSLLNWKVGEQLNVKTYFIERSIDGIIWKNIGEQAAFSSNFESYSYTDDRKDIDKITKTIFYRIKSVDADGKTSYSNVQQINIGSHNQQSFGIIPNPASNKITISLPVNFNAVTINIVDVFGRVIATQNATNNTTISLSTEKLKTGNYLVNISNKNGEVLTEKLVIVR